MSEQLLQEIKTFQTALDTKVASAVDRMAAINETNEKMWRRLDEIDAKLTAPPGDYHEPRETFETPGKIVTDDKNAFALLQQTGRVRIQVGNLWAGQQQKTLITSSTLGSATPGILSPQHIPGIVSLPKRRLRVRDLLTSRPAESNVVDFVKQTGSHATASPQVEASAKFEAAISLVVASAPVRTMAAWLPATRQALDDLVGLRQFIDSELLYALKLREEVQILAGDGTGENLTGLIAGATAYAGTYNAANDTVLDKLRHAILEMNLADEYPTGIVLSPKDMHDAQLVKTEEGGTANKGSYVAGDPLGGLMEIPTLWSLPVVTTNSIPPGTFLIGDFATGAQIRDRMDAIVDISFEHDDYFVKNKMAVRAESRLALPIFRTSAFLQGQF